MVYAFCVGMFIGLPVGCYLREVGYAHKFQSAYSIFFPDTDIEKKDKFRNRSKEFFN